MPVFTILNTMTTFERRKILLFVILKDEIFRDILIIKGPFKEKGNISEKYHLF